MHNIAEGFDSETNAEFIRFLRYAKRSCTEVQSELYVALDEEYISPNEFKDVYEKARRTRAAVRGFINYLKKYEKRTVNPEPNNIFYLTFLEVSVISVKIKERVQLPLFTPLERTSSPP